jgi:hypothetical protein
VPVDGDIARRSDQPADDAIWIDPISVEGRASEGLLDGVIEVINVHPTHQRSRDLVSVAAKGVFEIQTVGVHVVVPLPGPGVDRGGLRCHPQRYSTTARSPEDRGASRNSPTRPTRSRRPDRRRR